MGSCKARVGSVSLSHVAQTAGPWPHAVTRTPAPETSAWLRRAGPSRWGRGRPACTTSNAPSSFQPDPARAGLAAAVALGALRAEDRGAAEVPPPSPLRDGGQPGGCEGVGRRTPQRAGTAAAGGLGGTPSPSASRVPTGLTAAPHAQARPACTLGASAGQSGHRGPVAAACPSAAATEPRAVGRWEPLFGEAALWAHRRWVSENLAGAGRVARPCGGPAWAALLTGDMACVASLSDVGRQPCCSWSGWTLSTCPSGSDAAESREEN